MLSRDTLARGTIHLWGLCWQQPCSASSVAMQTLLSAACSRWPAVNASTGALHGLLSPLTLLPAPQVRLLTGVAFSESNLQSKLLYASACFTHGSWAFDRLNGPALQLFELQFRVSFVPKAGQQPAMALKPTPPLIAPLPPDLFYPFLTSAAGVPRAGASGMGLQQWRVMGALVWLAHAAAAWL